MRDGINFVVRDDLNVFNDLIECVFIEVDNHHDTKSKNVIVGNVYRPPNTNMELFNNHLTLILNKLKTEKKPTRIMGDFNIDLLKVDDHPASSEFVDIIFSHSLIPLITKPTRITSSSATLIDNIFATIPDSDSQSFQGILCSDISDHYSVFFIDYTTKLSISEPVYTSRNFSQANIDQFNTKLQEYDWVPGLLSDDPQISFSHFHKTFSNLYDLCFPVRKTHCNYKNKMPWLSSGLKKSIKIKNNLYLRSIRSPCYESEYKDYKSKLTRLLRYSEREYHQNLLTKHKSNLRKSWQIIKQVINKTKTNTQAKHFIVNNKQTSDIHTISNAFNSFFTNIGPSLARQIPISGITPSDLIDRHSGPDMCIEPTLIVVKSQE